MSNSKGWRCHWGWFQDFVKALKDFKSVSRSGRFVRLGLIGFAAASFLIASTGCSVKKLAVGTTSKVLLDAQPALKQEPDFYLAKQAIPGSLKTVEGFHFADPENQNLTKMLAEGYCQYASGFIEDSFERAHAKNEFDEAEELAISATKAYLRCAGYALEILGSDWQQSAYSDPKGFEALVAKAEVADRDPMMFLAMGLGGAINLNKDDMAMLPHLPKVNLLLMRVLELDKKSTPKDLSLAALPHLALGKMYTSTPKAFGGKPELGKKHFKDAFDLTNNKFLLAKVFLARWYAVSTQKRKLFRKLLVEVLQTDPAIWPDQRLANEIAHRRARFYLAHEKDWF